MINGSWNWFFEAGGFSVKPVETEVAAMAEESRNVGELMFLPS
jgi:hypothetical protein